MSKKIVGSFLIFSLICLSKANAEQMDFFGPFQAPSVDGVANIPTGARAMGDIVYDNDAGKFKGFNGSTFIDLSSAGNPVVATGSDYAINAAYITVSGSTVTTTTETGDWMPATHTYTSAGQYTLSINSGVFDNAPMCICTSETNTTCSITVGSNTSITLRVYLS